MLYVVRRMISTYARWVCMWCVDVLQQVNALPAARDTQPNTRMRGHACFVPPAQVSRERNMLYTQVVASMIVAAFPEKCVSYLLFCCSSRLPPSAPSHSRITLSHMSTQADTPYNSLQRGIAQQADMKKFAILVGGFEILLLILFTVAVEYPEQGFTQKDDIQYIFYLNVTIMMLIGFGFLMTFMSRYGLGAVGLTFLITVLCIPWCILSGRVFASLAGNQDYPSLVGNTTAYHLVGTLPKIQLNINALLQGNFAAAALLISFGAVIGKLSPFQVALLAILEVPIYSFNKEVVAIGAFDTLDMGGTIFIHLFGAYFGLAVAYMVGQPKSASASQNAEPTIISDVFSLIGTTFLWIYWPSFNGATAPLGQTQQMLTTANTVMALCSSCAWTFVLSAYMNRKISTVDVQNATLAGGVAVGASSNLLISPAGAMLIGFIAATVSVYGFNRVQTYLEEKLNLHDSCGVHNLHGMPALVGTICVVVATSIPNCRPKNVLYPRGTNQPWAQLEGALGTLAVAILGGLVVGKIVKACGRDTENNPEFVDDPYWTVAVVAN
jgi:ammonium transporter Rh